VEVPGVDPLDEDDPRTVGPYTLLGRLGDGGMGTVYLARRSELSEQGPHVALKVIRGDLARVPEFRARFLREAHAAQRVARFCTAEVLDVSVEGRRPYLVTEHIDGPDLATAVQERGPLPIADLERLAVAVASALTAIHAAGVVHRDLKPGNIMLSSSGARVIDFGIARALDATTMLTQAGVGTPAFMAPEQALGRPATAAADVYAWGGVILFAGTGRLPHGQAPTPVILYRAVHEDPDLTGLDPALRPLVQRALHKNPDERPTAHDLFLTLVGSRPTAAPGPPSAPSDPPSAPPEPPATQTPPVPPPSQSPDPLPPPVAARLPVAPAPTPTGLASVTTAGAPTVVTPPPDAPPVERRKAPERRRSGRRDNGRRWPRGALIATLASVALALVLVTVLVIVVPGGSKSGASSGARLGASRSPAPTSETSAAIACAKGSITGSGSSAQKNAVDEWVKAYQSACSGATINYQAAGSSTGRQQFISKQISFAGSELALSGTQKDDADARCAPGTAVDLPMAVGPISLIYTLSGVGDLQLSGPTLAKIFAGTIARWDDPAIKAENANASLPSATIATVHRSDGSGTTDNFTKFLKAVGGADWTFDSGSDWKAPGGQGAKGSDGVTSTVKSTENSIGYAELSYAENAGLSTVKVKNAAGEYVAPSTDGASLGLSTAKIADGDDLKLTFDHTTPVRGAYPLYLVTYEIACTKGLPADQAALVKSFLTYTASDAAQKAISDLGYAPLPDPVATRVRSVVSNLS
jgi:phosphate ABC transporter phosphate-binding protein